MPFLSFFILISLWAHAEAPLKNIACFDLVTKAISEAGTPENWLSLPDGAAAEVKDFGHVEIHSKNDSTKLVLRGKTHTKAFIFSAPSCSVQVAKPYLNTNHFGDYELAKLFKSNKQGLILIWSPHMDLSIKEVTDLSKYKLKRPVTVIMDPDADENFAREIQKKYQLPEAYMRRLDSSVLRQADITIHYPSVVFYKDSKILKRVPGFSGKALNQLTKEILP